MAKREPIRLPGKFEEALGDLLKVRPPKKETRELGGKNQKFRKASAQLKKKPPDQ